MFCWCLYCCVGCLFGCVVLCVSPLHMFSHEGTIDSLFQRMYLRVLLGVQLFLLALCILGRPLILHRGLRFCNFCRVWFGMCGLIHTLYHKCDIVFCFYKFFLCVQSHNSFYTAMVLVSMVRQQYLSGMLP